MKDTTELPTVVWLKMTLAVAPVLGACSRMEAGVLLISPGLFCMRVSTDVPETSLLHATARSDT